MAYVILVNIGAIPVCARRRELKSLSGYPKENKMNTEEIRVVFESTVGRNLNLTMEECGTYEEILVAAIWTGFLAGYKTATV
jgi:hypothetical protein